MRRCGLWALAVVAGCYQGPTTDASCSIACTDACPGDLRCVHGVCVGAGDTCEPTFAHARPGNGFACALDTVGHLWCWGANTHHQIDPSDQAVYDRARRVGGERWDDVSAGGGHVCGIRAGELYCWGRNDHYQVSGAFPSDVMAPTKIEATDGPARWTQVSAGYTYTCAIGDGKLWCWGADDFGQLGIGDQPDAPVPTPVTTTLADWTSVSTGSQHTCAISASTGVSCWGSNTNGELGDNTLTARNEPVAVVLPAAPTSVSSGQYMSCATTDAEELYCWGRAASGELGDPAAVNVGIGNSAVPIRSSGLTGWTSVVSAQEYSCALRGGEVWCWGRANFGGFGNGLWANSGIWTRIVNDGATEIALGWNSNLDDLARDSLDLDLTCMIRNDALSCWGDNRYGQLSNGGSTMHPTAIEVAGGHTWTTLGVGSSHVCGVDSGALYCWGSTYYGQVEGVEAGGFTPCGLVPNTACDVGAPRAVGFGAGTDVLALGGRHSCALAGSTITCWGDDAYNELGSPGMATSRPGVVTGTWTQLIGGRGLGQCAVDGGGATTCWGVVRNAFAKLGEDPHLEPTLDGMVALANGAGFACFLDASHQLSCFGDDSYYEFGDGNNPAGDQGVTALGRTYDAIITGTSSLFACGLRTDGQVECWGDNAYGETGGPTSPTQTPFVLPNLASCTQLTAGANHACALCGGDVYCWGDNRRGAIGSGPPTSIPITVPRKLDLALPGGDSWAQLESASAFTCARTTLGHAYCWGLGTHGGLGIGAVSASVPSKIELDP
jgi:alpha-tubulin suppressor-like RCC1 family protein